MEKRDALILVMHRQLSLEVNSILEGKNFSSSSELVMSIVMHDALVRTLN
jgi:hypothetical protein